MSMIAFSAAATVAHSQEKKIDLETAKQRFAKLVQAELDRKTFPGLSVAWVIDGKTVYEAGFGMADPAKEVPATPETVYRAGSVSKLFNAVAAMQLVEQGKLDLDAPIQAALPEFSILNPFEPAAPITIRQLLSHRAGMVREAPVGGYFDSSQPTIVETLASVASCALVNPPNTQTRYSNVGPTIVGRAVEVVSGKSFIDYQQRYLLGPLGMKNSAWLMNDALRPRLAKGEMRVNNGDGAFRFEAAPEFELGTLPAGNLYSTVGDLAKFAAFAMHGYANGATEFDAPILKPKSLREMFTPQLIPGPDGFGLGFQVLHHRGRKTVRHSGAVYGFSTNWVVMPEEKIGVVLMSNSDIIGGTVKRLTDVALDLLLAVTRDEAIPAPPKTIELSADALKKFEGDYESLGYWAKLEVKDGKLIGNLSTQLIELEPIAPLKFLADGRVMNRSPVDFQQDQQGNVTGFSASGQEFHRVDPTKTDKVPASWEKLVGSYGPSFIPLVISIRNGHLYACAENEYDYRLTPLNRVTFRLPPGMYTDEQIVFQLDAKGQPIAAILAGMYLPRREQ